MKVIKSLLIISLFWGVMSFAQEPIVQLATLRLPAGFTVETYVDTVHGARSMAIGENGTLFVGTRFPDTLMVYAFVDADGDNFAETRYFVDEQLHVPNGVAFFAGDLYVAEANRILRYDDIESRLDNPPEPVVIYDALPDEPAHNWRYLAIGPDERLYVSVGAPCNVCEYDEARFGLILSMNLDGSDTRIEAQGVRNSVGFDWHPQTGELWFTDNGRDWISDDLPPDELNRVTDENQNFGFPYCHGGYLEDLDFPRENACDGMVAPVHAFQAHVAPLGMRFYTGEMFPEEYQNQLFVAQHGSRNRTDAVGYQVSLIRLDTDGQVLGEDAFLTGFLQGQRSYEAWGRPVDILQMPDGALLISDDSADMIYRISYQAE